LSRASLRTPPSRARVALPTACVSAALLVAVVLGLMAYPAGAGAATLPVQGCVADAGSGVPAPTILVDDGWLADGHAAILQDWQGDVNPFVGRPPTGAAPTGDPVAEPYCATWRAAPAGPVVPAQWLYCLDHDAIFGCGDNPMNRSGAVGG
jgi:hypothetical protein